MFYKEELGLASNLDSSNLLRQCPHRNPNQIGSTVPSFMYNAYMEARPQISSQEFRQLKGERVDMVFYLGIDKNPTVTPSEKRYIRAVSRNIKLTKKPAYIKGMGTEDYLYEGKDTFKIQNEPADKLMNGLVYKEYEGGRVVLPFEEVIDNVADRASEFAPEVKTHALVDGFKSVVSGNFLAEIAKKQPNCIDWALGLTFVGNYYGGREDFKVDFVPYNIPSVANRTASTHLLGHDHYGIAWQEDGKSFVTAFPGATVPIDIIENDTPERKKLKQYLTEEYNPHVMENGEKKPFVDEVAAHVLSLYRAVKKLEKT